MGKVIGYSSLAGFIAYGAVWLATAVLKLDYVVIYSTTGVIGIAMVIHLWKIFPNIEGLIPQRKNLFLKKKYSVYYVLTFLKGARRQIFMVFAAFLLVEKFDYTLAEVTTLYLINKGANIVIAPLIGKIIEKIGERRALTFEYIGLIGVFIGYALVDDAMIAASLYTVSYTHLTLPTNREV